MNPQMHHLGEHIRRYLFFYAGTAIALGWVFGVDWPEAARTHAAALGLTMNVVVFLMIYPMLDDAGRYTATKQESDRHVWRVPTLRNVKETAPYFHNGLVPQFDEAVTLCAKGGSTRDLSPDEVSALVAFLGTLSGELPKQMPPKLL